MVWYDWDTNILEHSIIPISQSKHPSGDYSINTPLLSSRRWISCIIQCDVYQFITVTQLATSSENCKNENVTHICIQEVTVYHCTLLMLSKQKSVFCGQSNGSAANPIWTAFGRHQGTLDTGSLRHEEDLALCSLKKEKSYSQDSLSPTGSSSGSYWNRLEVWLQARRGGRGWVELAAGTSLCIGKGLNWWEQNFKLGSCLSSSWCRIHLQREKTVFGTCTDKDIHMPTSQLKLSLFQFTILLDVFISKRLTL